MRSPQPMRKIKKGKRELLPMSIALKQVRMVRRLLMSVAILVGITVLAAGAVAASSRHSAARVAPPVRNAQAAPNEPHSLPSSDRVEFHRGALKLSLPRDTSTIDASNLFSDLTVSSPPESATPNFSSQQALVSLTKQDFYNMGSAQPSSVQLATVTQSHPVFAGVTAGTPYLAWVVTFDDAPLPALPLASSNVGSFACTEIGVMNANTGAWDYFESGCIAAPTGTAQLPVGSS